MLRDSSLVAVGIDFGHSHVQVAVADIAHNVLAERRCDLNVSQDARTALDTATRMVDEVLEEAHVDRRSVIAAGMGIPGPVDRGRGTAGSPSILPGWTGLRIESEMQQRLGMPVEIENDANLGALAEMTWGAGRECSNFAYIKRPRASGGPRDRRTAPARSVGDGRRDRAYHPRRKWGLVLLRQSRLPRDRASGPRSSASSPAGIPKRSPSDRSSSLLQTAMHAAGARSLTRP